MRSRILSLTVASAILVQLSVFAAEPLNTRVAWKTESPQHEATISWDTTSASTENIVYIDTVSRAGQIDKYEERYAASIVGQYTEKPGKVKKKHKKNPKKKKPSIPATLFYHHVHLKGLQADTNYYLVVESDGDFSREFYFTTAPKGDESIKMIYAGDSRAGIEKAKEVSRQIAAMTEKDPQIRCLLHGGDFSAKPTVSGWIDWFSAYSLTTSPSGRLLPIIPIIGNHDTYNEDEIFDQAYDSPGGKLKNYYTVFLTPQVGLINLNSEISAEGDQKVFLKAELEKLQMQKVRWQIASFHKPAYPAVKITGSSKVSWVPLFEEYNINLVLESDGHCIKRTVPIKNDQKASLQDGIVYLGEGGYGAPQRDPQDRWYLGEGAYASKGEHIMLLEFTNSEINYQTILSDGTVADQFTFPVKSR